jgi:nitroreductase
MAVQQRATHTGLEDLLARPLWESVFRRRTHRVSRGASVAARSMSYDSPHRPQPLGELEEAVLIALTGCSGLSMPDRPFEDPRDHKPIMAKPNLNMVGRTAGSPDNAQGTHFFMINDSGTYYLRKLPPSPGAGFDPDTLLERAGRAKVKVLDRRLDVAEGMRDFPAYLDSNRFLSNLAGTTVFLPVVDLSHQYINALMYLLTQPDGARPTFVDDRNFYRPAGVRKWVRNGFLNPDLKLPLGALGPMRTQVEADLLLQNMMLVADAMGLGAWIHASINPQIMLGDPKFSRIYGRMLGFDFVTPRFKPADLLRWQVPLPKYAPLRAHPVGLRAAGEHLIKGACPPNYPSMEAAVDAVVQSKFGKGGIYEDKDVFSRIYKDGYAPRYLEEAGEYDQRVIDCARDVCVYIHATHGRFPAHTDAIHVPGIWLQTHHVETEYYERFFRNGLTDAHRAHAARWKE